VIASVVPEVNFNLLTLCRKYCKTEPLMVGAKGVALGTKALVDRPEEVAPIVWSIPSRRTTATRPADRGRFRHATTLDVIDRDGNYCGGVIAPGINLSLAALHTAAAQLPSVRISRTERVIGKDTVSCCNPAFIGDISDWSKDWSAVSRLSLARPCTRSRPAGWRCSSPGRSMRSNTSIPI
jgi:type III pantothenate kinase